MQGSVSRATASDAEVGKARPFRREERQPVSWSTAGDGERVE